MASHRVVIGQVEGGESLYLDLPTLIDTRVLITGNSGAGKSRLLRRLAEQAFGKVQVIVIDPEGEFPTLREGGRAFLLAGRHGEVQAEPRAAALLAKRLMELHVSAVLDLYDLRLQQRREFVRLFLEALIDLPKDLYAPVLVLLDEAHLFCPEKDEAESAAAVIDLMTRGRKRGVCGVLATQRLSKLDKDAAAEAKNVFVGGITLDVDQKRAADTLGLGGRDERLGLRDIPPGQFLAFGPALSARGVVTFTAGETFTTHPKAGQRHTLQATATPEAIQKVATELKDLPQQAAEEIRTLQAAQAKVRELERALREAKKAQPTPPPAPKAPKQAPLLKDAQVKRLGEIVQRLRDSMAAFLAGCERARARFDEKQLALTMSAGVLAEEIKAALAAAQNNQERGGRAGDSPLPAPPAVRPAPVARPSAPNFSKQPSNGNLAGGERKILTALAQYPEGRTKKQIAILAVYAVKGGGFNNYLGALRSRGFIVDGRGEAIVITREGLEALGDYTPLPTGPALLKFWLGQVAHVEGEILRVLTEAYPMGLTREAIAAQTTSPKGKPYEATGGGFNNALGRLRTLELIEGKGEMRAAEDLF